MRNRAGMRASDEGRKINDLRIVQLFVQCTIVSGAGLVARIGGWGSIDPPPNREKSADLFRATASRDAGLLRPLKRAGTQDPATAVPQVGPRRSACQTADGPPMAGLAVVGSVCVSGRHLLTRGRTRGHVLGVASDHFSAQVVAHRDALAWTAVRDLAPSPHAAALAHVVVPPVAHGFAPHASAPWMTFTHSSRAHALPLNASSQIRVIRASPCSPASRRSC